MLGSLPPSAAARTGPPAAGRGVFAPEVPHLESQFISGTKPSQNHCPVCNRRGIIQTGTQPLTAGINSASVSAMNVERHIKWSIFRGIVRAWWCLALITLPVAFVVDIGQLLS